MAGLFSSSTLEQIRAASDIVEIIGSYLPLKRAGANFIALCPFHKEKTPSFNINPQRQIFHCFGCHKGGDVFTFVQEYENLSFSEALRRLAERARIPLEYDQDPSQRTDRSQRENLLQLHEAITRRWQTALANDAAGQVARDYLARRGVNAASIQGFRLGYAPEAWDDTVNWARSKAYDLTLVERAGLILRKEGSDHYYDRFRGRLIFPITDEQGRVVAFSGRVLSGDEKTAKYVNSPETPIFTKGRVCYGLDKAKRSLLASHSAIICEGQLDLIACHQAGIENVVAPQGTALTAEQGRILKRYADEVVLCFDSDLAGQNAALRSFDGLLASGLAVRVTSIPSPHDPDSYLKEQGAEAFRQLVNRAPGFFDFLLDRLSAEHDLNSDRGRTALVKAMAEAVHKTGNAVLVDTYAQRSAQRLGVSVDAVRTDFRSAARRLSTGGGPRAQQAPPPAAAVSRPSTQEFWLLKLLLADSTRLDWAAEAFELEWLQHPIVRQIVERRLTHTAGSATEATAFLNELTDPQARSLATEAMADRRPIPNRDRQLVDLVGRLRNQHLDRELTRLTGRLALHELSDAEREALLRKQLDLRQHKHRPLAALEPTPPQDPEPQTS